MQKNIKNYDKTMISLIYNSDDAKMGHHIKSILLNKGDVK